MCEHETEQNSKLLDDLRSGRLWLRKHGQFYRLIGRPSDKLASALAHREEWAKELDDRADCSTGATGESIEEAAFWSQEKAEFNRVMDDITGLCGLLDTLDVPSLYTNLFLYPDLQKYVDIEAQHLAVLRSVVDRYIRQNKPKDRRQSEIDAAWAYLTTRLNTARVFP